MASDIRISELNEISINSDLNEIIINSKESTNDTGISKKIQVGNFLTENIVKTNNISAEAVTTNKLADKSITAIKIADKAITSGQILDNTICNNLLADNSVNNRTVNNDESFVACRYTATSSILSPNIEASNRLTVPSGQVNLNEIAYTFPQTESPRNFLRTDGSGNLTWEEAVPGDGTALVFSNISPVGTIIPYAGGTQTSIPDDKWINLFAERRFFGADYPELRDVLGTTWGDRTNANGDPSPTGGYYALPDLRARAVLGAGVGNDGVNTCNTLFATYGGAYKHNLSVGEMPSHNHNILYRPDAAERPGGYDALGPGHISTRVATRAFMQNEGGDQAHNNTQPYVAMSYIIKAKPDDIQQYDMSVGPGLSASDALGAQTASINLSSTKVGVKVTDNFTFDGSGRLELNDNISVSSITFDDGTSLGTARETLYHVNAVQKGQNYYLTSDTNSSANIYPTAAVKTYAMTILPNLVAGDKVMVVWGYRSQTNANGTVRSFQYATTLYRVNSSTSWSILESGAVV